MQCPPSALSHLKKWLPIYVLYGPETFLITESAALIRQAFLKLEVEHFKFTVDQSFQWEAVWHCARHPSLFAQKKLIELHLLTPPTAELNPLTRIDENTYFLIQSAALSSSQQQAPWFVFAQQHGVVCPHWHLNTAQFRQWFIQRLQSHQLKFDKEAVDLLIYYTQNNCLAAAQEIDRLCLYEEKSLSVSDLTQQSQVNVFDLCTAILQRQTLQVIKILNRLKAQAEPLALIIWALAQMIRALEKAAAETNAKAQCQQLLKAGIKASLHPLYLQALQHPLTAQSQFTHLLLADSYLKSGQLDASFQLLTQISLHLAGVRLFHSNLY